MRTRLWLLLAFFLLGGCGSVWAQSGEPELLRIHGSNLLGANLVPAMVESWLRDIGYTGIQRRELGPTRTEISASRDDQPVLIEIDKRGTASGINDLIEGNAEISMSARAPTAAELDAAWQLGDLRSPSQEWVIALDGVALLVAPNNPVAKISLPQLRAVISGKIGDWRALGGRPGPITLHTLGSDTGTQELLSQLALAGGKFAAPARRHRSYAEIVAAVASDPNGLGVVSLRAPRGHLKALAVRDGALALAPDLLAARSEDYPLLRRLYFHTGQLVTALGRSFAQYAISPAGQSVVERSQFVSLNLQAIAAGLPKEAPLEYQQIVGHAQRLPLTLHFSTGLDLLDSRARQDMERLADFLHRPENAHRNVVLVGFANPQPQMPYQALSMSHERVDYASSELLALNLRVVTVRGLGGRMNLIDAKEPSARQRNDRVEVWLR